MKAIVSLTLILLFVKTYFSQEQWSPIPPNFSINSSVYDIEMLNGKVYQIYSQNITGTDKLIVDFYDPINSSWQNLVSTNQVLFNKIVCEKIGNIIYIAGYENSNFFFYQLNVDLGTLNMISAPYAFSNANNNWEFHSGINTDELYVLYTSGTGPSDVHGLEFISGVWNSVAENFPQDLSIADLQIQSSSDKVYFGVYSNKIRLTYFNKGDIATMFAYDGALGEILSDGVSWDNSGFVITGNKNDYQAFYGTEDANNLSYEVPILNGTQINVNTSTDPSTSLNIDANFLAKESSPSHGFIMSMFSSDGLGNPNDKLQVIRRDFTQGGSQWEVVANSTIDLQGTLFDPNSLKLSLNNDYKHLSVAYTYQGMPTNEIKISNNLSYIINGSIFPNTGLCAGQSNEIYPDIQIMDDDFDQITITNAYSLNSLTTNISVIPYGFSNGVSKFKIFGVPTTSTDQIVIEYTDGFGSYFATLDAFDGNTTAPNIQFLANDINFCLNEIKLDLSQFVNYYDQGVFEINSQRILGTEINSETIFPIAQTGIIKFTEEVNGCIVSATANYYILPAPTIDIVTTSSACNQNNGTATATISGGGMNSSYFWNTGSSNLSLTDLAPGAYYLNMYTNYNCKAIAIANVGSTDITINGTISNPTCFGANDGGVQISVTGTTDYEIVWSNGQFSDNLTNVSANTYECTLYDAGGCIVKKSYVLNEPTTVDFSFVTQEPDCSLSNGKIFTTLSGGTSPYSKLWNNGMTTSNINGLLPGIYTLTVTDNLGCIFRDSIALSNPNSVVVEDSLFYTECGFENGGIDVTISETPLSGPVNSILWSNGSTAEDIFNLAHGDYVLNINYGSDCEFFKTFHIGTKGPRRTDICLVTVDDSTTTNLIVWEKNETTDITYYNIYRENSIVGDYMLIDTIHYSNLSVFNDVVASPMERSWRYRLSAVNTCGVESARSVANKTLHLDIQQQANPQVYIIYWDIYEGSFGGEYIVNRFTDQNGWEQFSLLTSPSNAFLLEYTDTVPVGSTGLDYYVDIQRSEPCTATFRATDFNVSRSNKDKGIFNPGEGAGYSSNAGIAVVTDESFITVYPNPFENNIKIQLSGSTAEIKLLDIQGKLVHQQTCVEGLTEIDTSNFDGGLFFIQVQQGKENKVYKLSKFK